MAITPPSPTTSSSEPTAVEAEMSPVVKALRMVLGERAEVFDYAREEHFERLWRALDGSNLALTKPVVICWSRTFSDPAVAPVNTERHVTPLDWAACAAATHLQVCVLDLDGVGHERNPAVELYDRLDQGRIAWLRVLRIADLVECTSRQDLIDHMFPQQDRKSSKLLPEMFSILRRHTLTDPDPSGDRHAITNLVGPLVLLGRKPEEVEGHVKALWHLLRRAGLMPHGHAGGSEPDQKMRNVAALQQLAPVRVVLLDDQWHQGWAEWVSQRLDLPWNKEKAAAIHASGSHEPQCLIGQPRTGLSIWVADSPGWLLDGLTTAMCAEGRSIEPVDARFRLRLTPGEDDASEILLLDLRLFPAGSDEEKNFANKAAQVARRFVAAGAWPTFAKDKLDLVKRWAESSGPGPGGKEGKERRGARGDVAREGEDRGDGKAGRRAVDRATVLTLLPRLVAHADLSLPIVLFSSTGRRDIVDKLDGYDSIVTRFSKPRFFGDATDVAYEAEHGFDEAIEAASVLARGRRQVRSLLSRASTPSRPAATGASRIEIYIDESGSEENPPMCVGGLAVIYPSAGSVATFSDSLRTNGIAWGFDCDTTGRMRPQDFLPKRPMRGRARDWARMKEILHRIETLAADQGIEIAAFSVEGKPTDAEKAEGALPSLLYRRLLRQGLEILLFEWPPGRGEGIEVSVYAGTRYKPGLDEAELRREYKDPWGIPLEYGWGEWRAKIFTHDDVHPIVSELRARRLHAEPRPMVVSAKAVTLDYYKDREQRRPPAELPRQLHYAADWVLPILGHVPDTWQMRGFREGSDPATRILLDGGAAADKGRRPDAAVILWSLVARRRGDEMADAPARWIGERVAVCAADLTGEEFIRVCNGLNE